MRLAKGLAILESFYGDPGATRTRDLRLRRPQASVSKTTFSSYGYAYLSHTYPQSSSYRFTSIYIGLHGQFGGDLGEAHLLVRGLRFLNNSADSFQTLTHSQHKSKTSLRRVHAAVPIVGRSGKVKFERPINASHSPQFRLPVKADSTGIGPVRFTDAWAGPLLNSESKENHYGHQHKHEHLLDGLYSARPSRLRSGLTGARGQAGCGGAHDRYLSGLEVEAARRGVHGSSCDCWSRFHDWHSSVSSAGIGAPANEGPFRISLASQRRASFQLVQGNQNTPFHSCNQIIRGTEVARFTGGWIKLHRDILNKDIGHDPALLGLFCWLLMAATVDETTINWKGHPRKIPRGTVVFGVLELAEKFGVSRNTIYRRIKYLQERQTISFETSTTGCLAFINKFEDYQLKNTTTGQRRDNELNNDGTLNEEYKKERRVDPVLSEPMIDSLLDQCSSKLQSTWITTYKDPYWIKSEIKKANVWLQANPGKRKKISAFLSNWLNTAFDERPPKPNEKPQGVLDFGATNVR